MDWVDKNLILISKYQRKILFSTEDLGVGEKASDPSSKEDVSRYGEFVKNYRG